MKTSELSSREIGLIAGTRGILALGWVCYCQTKSVADGANEWVGRCLQPVH